MFNSIGIKRDEKDPKQYREKSIAISEKSIIFASTLKIYNMVKSLKRNGYLVKWSIRYGMWQVIRMSDRKVMEEFAARSKAVKWAEGN